MGKNRQDITHREDADPVAKLSFLSGLLSIPASFFLLGLPLGIVARIMGGKVLNRGENIPVNPQSWGKAKLGKSFGCAGIIFSVIWCLILLGMVIVGYSVADL